MVCVPWAYALSATGIAALTYAKIRQKSLLPSCAGCIFWTLFAKERKWSHGLEFMLAAHPTTFAKWRQTMIELATKMLTELICKILKPVMCSKLNTKLKIKLKIFNTHILKKATHSRC